MLGGKSTEVFLFVFFFNNQYLSWLNSPNVFSFSIEKFSAQTLLGSQ